MNCKIPLLFVTLLALILLPITPPAHAGGKKPKSNTETGYQPSQHTAKSGKYIRMADNFLVFYDPSTAMTVPYKDTGMTRLEKSKEILLKSNASLPDLLWQSGLYPHWKNVMWLPGAPESFHPYYRLQNWQMESYAMALEELPVISSGPPMLQMAMMKLEFLLGLPGRTEVFIFSNGEDARFEGVEEPEPVAQAKMLADKFNVCFTIISSATTKKAKKVLYDISRVNDCSQVIDFDTVAAHPEHLFGKLYTTADGIFKNVLFDFDKYDIKPDYSHLLDKAGRYLLKHPSDYVVLSGFCDIIGTKDYNIRLSQRRAESAQKYLLNKFKIKKERVLLYWYGYANPVASNATAVGRRLNRRVTIQLRKGI